MTHPNHPSSLEDRRLLIIGATGGIGSTLTRRLAAAGAELLLVARHEGPLGALAEEVGAEAHAADASSFGEMEELFENSRELDGVVNLAGSILLKPASSTSEANFRETIDLNLTTAFAIVRSAPQVMKQGGSIVHIERDRPRKIEVDAPLGPHRATRRYRTGHRLATRSRGVMDHRSGARR